MNIQKKSPMTAEQHPGSEQAPCTHCTVASVIDPSNGDNGCYAHTWEDQTARKEPSASAVHAPDWAASIHYAFLAGKQLDQSTFFRKVKGGGERMKNYDRTLAGNTEDWKAPPSFLTVDLKRTQAPSGKGWRLHLQQLTNEETDSGCETSTWKQPPEPRFQVTFTSEYLRSSNLVRLHQICCGDLCRLVLKSAPAVWRRRGVTVIISDEPLQARLSDLRWAATAAATCSN